MPIQAPQWTDYLNCPACCREFSPRRSPISLSCGHTLCRPCLKNLIRKQCPFDQSVISMDLEELAVNTALLQLMGYDPPAQPSHPLSIQSLSEQDRRAYDVIVKSLEQLAVFLKYCCTASVNMIGNRLSRPMQRKLVTLLQCALMDEEGRGKAARAARSLGERTVSELILQHQNPQQLSANLWAAVRSRGCQFLGPAMQEEVLKLVLLALEDGSPLSRKVLVMFVVQRLEPHFPQASKTSIGHVVQLLYRASCFKVSKRESDSSLMQLKEEFRTYECLRREHDAQIVQIATESGLRIAPDQWSALLYGDTSHKSHMQSIIDKLQTPHSFAQSVQELFFALQRTDEPAQMLVMSISLDRLTNIDPSPDAKSPSWQELSHIMSALKDVVSGLVDYMQHHAAARDANHNLKTDRLPDSTTQPSSIASLLPGRYKVAMCRDAQARTFCPRGNNCTYAHTEEELERVSAVLDARVPHPSEHCVPSLAADEPRSPGLGVVGGALLTTQIRYRRLETSNGPSGYNTSPQPMAQTSTVPRPVFIYPSPRADSNYNRMPSFSPTAMPQLSSSVHEHGVPDQGDVPNKVEPKYARSRSSSESQKDVKPRPNQPGRKWSYANAVTFGAANNRQHQNPNGAVSPLEPPGQIEQSNGPSSHPYGDPGHLGEMRRPNHVNTPRDVSVNDHGGGIMRPPPNGGMVPYNGGMCPPFNGGIVPINGGMRPPLNGGMALINGGIGQYLPPRLLTLDDAMKHVNGGHEPPTDSRYFPRQPSEKSAPLQQQNDNAPMPALQGMGAMGTDCDVPEFKPRQYGANGMGAMGAECDVPEFKPRQYGAKGIGAMDALCDVPEFKPRQYGASGIGAMDALCDVPEFKPRQYGASGIGAMDALCDVPEFKPRQYGASGVGAMDALCDVPEFKPRQYGASVTTELQNFNSYGLRSETKSPFENNWQPIPTPPIEHMQRNTMFSFTKTAKNLPEGMYQHDRLPMGINLTKPPPMYLENQHMFNYPSNTNYNQHMFNNPFYSKYNQHMFNYLSKSNYNQHLPDYPSNSKYYQQRSDHPSNLKYNQQRSDHPSNLKYNQYMPNYAPKSNSNQPMMVDKPTPSMLDMPDPSETKQNDETVNKVEHTELATNESNYLYAEFLPDPF